MRKIILSLLLVSLAIFIMGNASAIVITSCQTIGSSGNYTMNMSIVPNGTNQCIKIQASNVNFDCLGFAFVNTTGFNNYILYDQGSFNTTIANCILNGTSNTASTSAYAINLLGSRNSSLFNITINGAYIGVYQDATNGTTVDNLRINNASSIGYNIPTKSQFTNITNSFFQSGNQPLRVVSVINMYMSNTILNALNGSNNVITISSASSQYSQNITFENNLILNSSFAGISSNVSNNIVFKNNTLRFVTSPLTWLNNITTMSNNKMQYNTISNSTYLGSGGNAIRVDGFADGWTIEYNNFSHILNNAGNGRLIVLQGGSNNTRIIGNLMNNNVTSSEYIGINHIINFNTELPNSNLTVLSNVIGCAVNGNSSKGTVIYSTNHSNFSYNTYNNCQFGLLYTNDTSNNYATGNNMSGNDAGFVFQEGAVNNYFGESTINGTVSRCGLITFNNITSVTPTNNTAKNIICKGLAGAEGIRATSGVTSTNYLYDSTFNVSGFEVTATQSSTGLQLINVTYLDGTTNESVGAGSSFSRWWWYDASTNIGGVAITMTNLSGASVLSTATDVAGAMNQFAILEYINDAATRTYATPHTRTATFSLYTTDVATLNFTLSQNIFESITLVASGRILCSPGLSQTFQLIIILSCVAIIGFIFFFFKENGFDIGTNELLIIFIGLVIVIPMIVIAANNIGGICG